MDPVAWATESHRLAEKFACPGTVLKPPGPAALRQAYSDKCLPVVDEQLTKAGLRLAAMPNGIFDPVAAMPDTAAAVAPSSEPPEKPAAPFAPAHKADTRFVGSKNSEVYHVPCCSVVHQGRPENLVEYKEAPAGKRLHQGCPR